MSSPPRSDSGSPVRSRLALLAGLLILAGVAVWLWLRDTAPAPSAAAPGVANGMNSARPGAATAAAAERSTLADELNLPTGTIDRDLRVVQELVATFRTNFPQYGNPVGNNAEITAALSGGNTLRLALLPRDHPAINRDGELCDRWGTPFFFHAESATRMDIRSAGPDRRMWTDDDVVLSP